MLVLQRFLFLQLVRFSDAGMTKLSPRSIGRRPKSAKARNRDCGRQWCGGRYGDLVAGSGARVMKRGGAGTRFSSQHEHDWGRERAACVLRNEVAVFLVVIARATGVAARASALWAESQHGRSV
jgi:hypothetical protein